ncbi:hypothetical protein C0Q70_02276 [Pomacea canaliculata]|uniref:Cation-transporting ATPase n=1 Tax=Pomacea canaliculata TaxID=400727 RepID=A0A2T7PPG4_POMCA|nr:hypothetical protein C0Q70_02276 [Pomacea canaliculata]
MGQMGIAPMVAGHTYLNPGQDDQMEVRGYRLSLGRYYLSWVLYFLTVGLLRLLFYWLPHRMVEFTHTTCPLSMATTVILKDQYDQYFVTSVNTNSGTGGRGHSSSKTLMFNRFKKSDNFDQTFDNPVVVEVPGMRWFVSKKVKYVWDEEQQNFVRLRGLEVGHSFSYFHQLQGFTVSQQAEQRQMYGINSVAVHVTPIIVLLFKEVLSPFYIFQLFSMILWYVEGYVIYASCILVISSISIVVTIYQTRKFQRELRNTISSSTLVTVCRGEDVFDEIQSEDLVPGDVIEIPRRGCMMQCDCVLISGNCIVNESMLTGESVPITKTSIPNPIVGGGVDETSFSIKKHSRHVLFSGTQVIQTRFYGSQRVKAVVLQTGFSTSKGELVRSILYPKPVDFKFQRHSYYFVLVLALIAMMGFIYTIILKTGTLTEDGLNMQGVVPASGAKFDPEIRDLTLLPKGPLIEAMATCHSLTIIEGQLMGDPLDLIMFNATNWELEEPGEEESRFDMIVPTIVRPKNQSGLHYASTEQLQGEDLGIVRQFPFSSSLQRMSVITRQLGAQHFNLFVKGSPEMIASLSLPHSVPLNFHDVLTKYTQHGYRVIAFGKKQLPSKLRYAKIQRLQREQVECNLTFLGLLVMENRLKPQTTPVIHKLLEANIRTIMVTGDNMLTALSVARECGMVDRTDKIILVQASPPEGQKTQAEIEFYYADDRTKQVEEVDKHEGSAVISIDEDNKRFHFAVTGKSWGVIRQYQPELLSKLVVRGTVFARMSPDQKAQLIEVLQEVGYHVGMCGDGANDCGALKAAHAGISLSEAEASVASPFTSRTPTIECVPSVIREGRCSLVTAFGIFKFMACYSMNQFTSVMILYWIGANLTDPEFLYEDLFLATTLFITFSWTGPYEELAKQLPPMSLISVAPILSIITQMTVMIVPQALAFLYVQQQPWFVPFQQNEDNDYTSYENSAVFLLSAYQYITMSITFSKGAPYRKTMFSNWLFLGNIAVCTAVTIWITMYPTEQFADVLDLKPFPSISFRALVVGVAFINCLVSVILEMFIVDNTSMRDKCGNAVGQCCKDGSYQYREIETELKEDPSWPPVSCKSIDLATVFQRLENLSHTSTTQQYEDYLEHILESDEEDKPDSRRGSRTGGEGVQQIFNNSHDPNLGLQQCNTTQGVGSQSTRL